MVGTGRLISSDPGLVVPPTDPPGNRSSCAEIRSPHVPIPVFASHRIGIRGNCRPRNPVQFSDDRKWHPVKLKNRQPQVALPSGILRPDFCHKSTVFESKFESPVMSPDLLHNRKRKPLSLFRLRRSFWRGDGISILPLEAAFLQVIFQYRENERRP
jgi:hypothetical protein